MDPIKLVHAKTRHAYDLTAPRCHYDFEIKNERHSFEEGSWKAGHVATWKEK